MFSHRLIHWITALSFAMSAAAPSIAQVVSVVGVGQGLSMDICIADGSKLAIDLKTDDKSEVMLDCPNCVLKLHSLFLYWGIFNFRHLFCLY